MNLLKTSPICSLSILGITLMCIALSNLAGYSLNLTKLADFHILLIVHAFLAVGFIATGFAYSWLTQHSMLSNKRSETTLITLLTIVTGAFIMLYSIAYTYLSKYQVILEVLALNDIKHVIKTATPTMLALGLFGYLAGTYLLGYYLLALGNRLYFWLTNPEAVE
jgi:uncharacterized membrane protein